jgi:hypothetical protein
MNSFSVGVRLRNRKSARNPSSDIRIVVGAKKDVPFETIVTEGICCFGIESLYAKNRRTRKRTTMEMYMLVRRHMRDRRPYAFILTFASHGMEVRTYLSMYLARK